MPGPFSVFESHLHPVSFRWVAQRICAPSLEIVPAAPSSYPCFSTGRSSKETGNWRIPTAKSQHISRLFAKELVVKNFAGAPPGELLERLIELSLYMEEHLK